MTYKECFCSCVIQLLEVKTMRIRLKRLATFGLARALAGCRRSCELEHGGKRQKQAYASPESPSWTRSSLPLSQA